MAGTKERLLVAPSDCEDAWRVNLSQAKMTKLGLVIGEHVKLTGLFQRDVVRLAAPFNSVSEDNKIRIDKYSRLNLRVKIGDVISVTKIVNVPFATRIRVVAFADTIRNIPTNVCKSHLVTFFTKHAKPLKDGEVFLIGVDGFRIEFKVDSVDPKGTCIVNQSTRIDYLNTPITDREVEEKCLLESIDYSSIGGLKVPLSVLRDVLEFPFRHPLMAASGKVELPKGILLTGQSGVGKTLLVTAVANEMGACLVVISGTAVKGMLLNDAEQFMSDCFETADQNQPGVIFIKELDVIAPSVSKDERLLAQLLTLTDRLESQSRVVVIGSTTRPDAIDQSVFRCGRFTVKIDVVLPSLHDREDILRISCRNIRLSPDVDLKKFASETSGLSGRDLKGLCRMAEHLEIKNNMTTVDLADDSARLRFLSSIIVTKEMFEASLEKYRLRSNRKERAVVPRNAMQPVGIYKAIVDELLSFVQPSKQGNQTFPVTPVKGCILFGPPGNGKSSLVSSLANQCNRRLVTVRGPAVLSPGFGTSEANVRDVFDEAKSDAPCILLLDELESIAAARGKISGKSSEADRVVDQLITQLDAVKVDDGVFIVGTTNRLETLDTTVRRNKRLAEAIYVPMPDLNTRLELFANSFKVIPISKDVKLEYLAERTDGYTIADLSAICEKACAEAAKESSERSNEDGPLLSIGREHFITAMKKTRKTLTKAELVPYEQEAAKLYETAMLDFRFPDGAPSYYS